VVDAARTIMADSRVSGVVWIRNDARTGAILAGEVEPLLGRPTIIETVATEPVATRMKLDIELGIGDFFQVNRDQAARLYARVAELAAGATRALDLYCGVGGIAFTLAGANPGTEVLGIERNPGAVAAANRAAERAGLQARVHFRAGVAADALDVASGAQAGSDLVVVNPPRKGLDSETLAALRQIAPATIIYVSCGPESLARDLSILSGSGLSASGDYRVERVEPFDLMPGTPQVETVAVLARALTS
jgi:23S rRNA (uracil1939-C5)-methyltransferase